MARQNGASGISAWRSLALVLGVAMAVNAADHRDAPLISLEGRADLNDVYIFQSPANPSNTVLIMTVNPFAGVLSPTTFHPHCDYDFKIDRNGDAKEDFTLRVTFDKARGDSPQKFRVQITPPIRADVDGRRRRLSNLGSGRTGEDVELVGGAMAHAGIFDDPFFFDIVGFRNGFMFTGDDMFADFNVGAIVLEVPSQWLGDNQIGMWARTFIDKDADDLLQGSGDDKHEKRNRSGQVDRTGLPAINTVLIPLSEKDAFNMGQPRHDRRDFEDVAIVSLMNLGNDLARAQSLVSVLLPDIMPVDTSSSAGFLNGRQLADDVIDIELDLLSNGAITSDLVDSNDKAFLATFPYLASPH